MPGIVNYHPGRKTPDDHWHVQWQRDDQPRRAIVRRKPKIDVFGELEDVDTSRRSTSSSGSLAHWQLDCSFCRIAAATNKKGRR